MYIILNKTSHIICRYYVKQYKAALRSISILNRFLPPSVLLDKSNHKIVYEFPYIMQTSYLIRSKVWFPAVIAFISPIGLFFEGAWFTIVGGLIASGIHCGLIHLASKYLANTVGKVYVNKGEECNDVIISSIDSFGSRIDRRHNPSDLEVCEYSSRIRIGLGFVVIFARKENLTYHLNVVTSKIHNKETFCTLFGNQWYLPEKK